MPAGAKPLFLVCYIVHLLQYIYNKKIDRLIFKQHN